MAVVSVTPLRGGDRNRPIYIPRLNEGAEQGLLGAILCNNRYFHRIASIVAEQQFGIGVHARLWTELERRIAAGALANPVTLKAWADTDEALKPVGGASYLAQLVKAANTLDASAAEDYARVVADAAKHRTLMQIVQELLDRSDTFSGAEIAAWLENKLSEFGTESAARFGGIDPRTLKGLPVPVREFIVTPWIPKRRATGLYGIGGAGKSTLMQMLCTSCALDPIKFPHANWLGLPVRHCRSVLLFAEDDVDEMHARQDEINRAFGCIYDDLGAMLWLPRLGTDVTLMNFEGGRAVRTPAFFELLRIIKVHRAELAVWDTLTDVFGGAEIDRRQAREFVQLCPAYVAREIEGAVICAGHPSLAGINSGNGSSGSTGWDGAFRSRLYLSSPKAENGEVPDGDGRILTRVKSNWAKVGETITMHWREGVFIPDRSASGIAGSIERRACEQVFLELLDKVTSENQPVSSNNRAGNYAPKLFSKRPDRDGFVKANFEASMYKLFAACEIVNIDYGRKHDERTRIVRRS
jgi:RecA-family ATPase